MNGYDCRCPHCQGDDIFFLEIKNVGTVDEEVVFYCSSCQKYVGVKGLRAGYLPNIIALLKENYPWPEK